MVANNANKLAATTPLPNIGLNWRKLRSDWRSIELIENGNWPLRFSSEIDKIAEGVRYWIWFFQNCVAKVPVHN